MPLNLGRALGVLVAALASGLCLCACASDEPSLSEIRGFRAYPVYYSGVSVAGNSLREVSGDPAEQKNKRDTTWVLIYGKCKDPPAEGGCQVPLQIHNYSICARWEGSREGRLFDFRGAKATRPTLSGPAVLEIYTGRTTVTVSAENREVLDSAAQALRGVHQRHPTSLPPPVPGSLRGELPCQGRPG